MRNKSLIENILGDEEKVGQLKRARTCEKNARMLHSEN